MDASITSQDAAIRQRETELAHTVSRLVSLLNER